MDSRSWWWTGRPGELWFMGLQRVRHDWVTELNWTEYIWRHLAGLRWESGSAQARQVWRGAHIYTHISFKWLWLSDLRTKWLPPTRAGVAKAPEILNHFFKKLIYLNWRWITLLYCGRFCHTLTWVSHGCTCVPHPELPLLPPSPSHPSGLSQCTSFECPASSIKLARLSVLHLVIYMFQSYSLISSHPSLLPQSTKFVL